MEKEIQKKLNQLEGFLSLKHMGRDFLFLELAFIISIVVASLLIIWVVSTATGATNPQEVYETTETTTYYLGWILFIGLQTIVITYYRVGKKKSEETKQEIIRMFETKEEENK